MPQTPSDSQHLEVKNLCERGRAWALDVPPDNTTAESWLFSLNSSWSMQSITQKSGSHSRQPPGSQGQGILTPPYWSLLLSYSAVTQNAELFIQTDGKTVKKVSQSPGDYGGERWDTWIPVPAPQSCWEGNNITYSGIPDLVSYIPGWRGFFWRVKQSWRSASFQTLEGAKPGLPASLVNT